MLFNGKKWNNLDILLPENSVNFRKYFQRCNYLIRSFTSFTNGNMFKKMFFHTSMV